VTESRASDVIVVALCVADAGLADRLAALLADAPGVRLATAGEPADVRMIDSEVKREVIDSEAALTPRETEVLILLAEGASNKVIARRLGISLHTVKFHVGQILDKLDASGRADAVAHAARLGVLHL